MTASQRLVVVHPDAQVLAAAAAARLITKLLDLQSQQSPSHIVLTGGTVGIATLAQVAASPLKDAVDWTEVHVWWGDERYVPAGDKDRNEVQAQEALLDHLPLLPQENIHRVLPAVDGVSVDQAAQAYAEELAKFAAPGAAAPAFDVLMLGMGPDAHVASLFPGHPGLNVTGSATAGIENSPKPPPLRVSLTFEAIQGAKEVWIIASGAEKAPAVAAGLAGAPVVEAPVAGAVGTQRTLWLIDTTSAGTED